MGVQNLWPILSPCARPIKLETLNRKRLAVDASIWIYQFLKAVRDKEGNALRNSHVVGFFRRICKLLFFGIKPVFVFDGGAPALKRETIRQRKSRREGRRDDAVKTAGKMLAVQMQRRAEEDERERKKKQSLPEAEEEVPEDLVYVDEIGMSAKERQQSRKFKKKDAYHLPDLDTNLHELRGSEDPRIMSLEELQAYASSFSAEGEDVNLYDFSAIDYDSAFFTSLPATDRYNILNAARLRSRLRMGHSKEQLDEMFPDRMAFSRFQIERVRERNELTQRLMHLNEGGETLFDAPGRVAGEKGREYVLVKNDGVEGGWALGVISDDAGSRRETAIDVELSAPVVRKDEDEEDDDFVDVPIEGLNRLPKRGRDDAFAAQRKDVNPPRRRSAAGHRKKKRKIQDDSTSLFVAQDDVEDEEWEPYDPGLFGEEPANEQVEEEDEDLRQAIAMSLQNETATTSPQAPADTDAKSNSDDEMEEIFNRQTAVPESKPVPKGSGRAIANLVNARSHASAPESREITSFGVPAPRSPTPEAPNTPDQANDSDDSDEIDLQAALAASRQYNHQPKTQISPKKRDDPTKAIAKAAGFSGPLPFASLDLGTSLLGKKKMQERSEGVAGGFINPEVERKEQEKRSEPLPPWFEIDPGIGIAEEKERERERRAQEKKELSKFRFDERGFERGGLGRKKEEEVIDLEREDSEGNEVVVVEQGEGEILVHHPQGIEDVPEEMELEADTASIKPKSGVDETDRLLGELDMDAAVANVVDAHPTDLDPSAKSKTSDADSATAEKAAEEASEEEELLDWSESEDEREKISKVSATMPTHSIQAKDPQQPSRSPSAEFEDVTIPDEAVQREASPVDQEVIIPSPPPGLTYDDPPLEEEEVIEFEEFSDPEEEEILRQLTLEAEEHARFASSLNNKSQADIIADYEKELKQLRNQQKKDRRDADEVTHVMIEECQALLRLFGLPFITAPMEAEAQCAELVRLGLVDGIVTDDSDCFLFGGTRVYKNMFNQAKFVECYLLSDLEKEFALTREKLIQIAQLLGSDYTEGLSGVGPVTALEILGEFATLAEFKDWWNGVQMGSISKAEDKDKPFRKKFRKNTTKLFLPTGFPDPRVEGAYLLPEVDSNPESFQWGVPDLGALRAFLMATIGWNQERTDEVLVPVIKDMNRRADEGTQSNITKFFEGGVGIGSAGGGRGEAFAPRRRAEEGSSKRMGKALGEMAERARKKRESGASGNAGLQESEHSNDNDSGASVPTAKPKRKAKARRMEPASSDEPDEEPDGEHYNSGKANKKPSRKAATKRRKQNLLDDD